MSKRTSIVKALSEEFKKIDGTGSFKTNLYEASFPVLKFWDEVNNFPCIYTVPGLEHREYHPGGFAWGLLNVSVKVYTKGETSQDKLEDLLSDIELLLDNTLGRLVYDQNTNDATSEINITSIATDEGLLAPYSVGEINLLVRYERKNS